MDNKNAKIGMFEHQPSGCYWYRTKHPFDALNKAGIDTRMINLDEDIEFYDSLKSVQLYGIYPFSFEKVLKVLKADGKKIIYDMDDLVSKIDITNPFYYAVKKDAGSSLQILEYADHITVATQNIADALSTKTNKPITVVPNCYSKSEWLYERPEREGIRIGFAGSCTHVPDLIQVLPVIKKLQAKHDIRFLIMGFGKQSYEEWFRDFSYSSPEEAVEKLWILNDLLKEVKFEWIPYVEYVNYPATLRNMALDIGLCPLKDTPFNNARSASKAMEYTLSGALALASDSIPYRDDKSSVLVKDNEWEEKITFYVENPDKRKEVHKSHIDWLKENRNINSDKMISLLKSIYGV